MVSKLLSQLRLGKSGLLVGLGHLRGTVGTYCHLMLVNIRVRDVSTEAASIKDCDVIFLTWL